ncbi:hypothetical protein GCM10020000_30770 [Streptomyces olivoverticillatus]
MSALTVDHSEGYGHEWDELVRIWEETDAPEGCKVEIIEGIITVSPAPANRHNVIAGKIQRALYTVIPEDWGCLSGACGFRAFSERPLHPGPCGRAGE